MLIGSVATVLSVAFALLIVGPVFLYADIHVYHAPTEGEISHDIDDNALREATYGQDVPDPFIGPEATASDRAKADVLNAQKKAADDLAQKEQADQLAAAFTCTLLNPKACVAGLMDIVLGLAARTLWIAGVLFNITVDYTLNLNTLLTQLPIVDIGWKILRDLANIVFIFIALWAGISITLGIGDDGKKAWGLLAQMVLVALFINFSLFITKAVVDVSNVAALHFYSLIVPAEGAKKYDSGLAEAYLYGLKLGTIYNSKQIGSGEFSSDNSQIGTLNKNSSDKSLSFSNIILIGFFGSLFIIITAWVFFAGAIMFIYRAITLMMLMMLSPLAFVGLILPGASGMAHAWWHKLWSQAFFAPLYLILAYIVVRTINSPAFGKGLLGSAQTGEQIGFAAALTGTGSGTIVVIFNFVMLIGLMVGCLIVAQHLGAKGSEMAMAGFEKIKKVAIGGAVGVAGAGARGLIKAPSAVLRGAGSMATGGATKAVGGWMANSRLLNNKMMQEIGVSGWASRKSKEYGEAAEKMRGSKFNQIISKGATMAGNAVDVRYLEERAGKSWAGNTFVGKALRSVTTGAMANVKIGNQSLEEAHEEAEHDSSIRRDITHGEEARKAGDALHTVEEVGEEHQENLHHAQGAEAEKKKELDDAEANLKKVTADPHATAEEKTAALGRVTTLKSEVANATSAVTTAEGALKTWKADNESKQKELRTKISEELAHMSTEGFLNLPKHYFQMNSIMDIEVLGAEKFGAFMNSEHFTHEEKEEAAEARTERIHHQGTRATKRNKWHISDVNRWQGKQSEWEAKDQVATGHLTNDLKDVDVAINSAQAKITEEEKAYEEATDPGEKAMHDHALKAAETELETKQTERGVIEDEIKEKRIKEGLRDASGEKMLSGEVLGARPEAEAVWESPAIRKALRNIKSPQELLHYYRYNRGLLNMEPFVQTVGQGVWNKVRESETVDSGTKEQIRVIKRQYLQEGSDYSFGGDAVTWKDWDEKDPVAAQAARKELNDYLLEHGEKKYKEEYWTPDATTGESKLGVIFKKGGYAEEATLSSAEREQRHKAGQYLMEVNIQNLADDEAAMLPGSLRNLHWVKSVLSRGLLGAFKNKDLDEKVPDMQNLITSVGNMFKGENVERTGNLDFLVWLVNERGGKDFISDEQLRLDGEQKELWEAIKMLAKQRDDSRGSTFKDKKAALRWLKDNGYFRGRKVESPWRKTGVQSRGEDKQTDKQFYGDLFGTTG